MDFDVAIIGGGFAGFIAGITALKENKKVVLIRKSQGATALSTSLVDVVGYYSPDPFEPYLSPVDGIKNIIKRNPYHPYTILQSDTGLDCFIDSFCNAIDFLKSSLENSGLIYNGGLDKNAFFLNNIGTTKVSCLAPSATFSGEMSNFKEKNVVFIGFKGFPDFNPNFLVKAVNELKSNYNLIKNTEFSGCYINFPTFENRGDIVSVEMAKAIDSDDKVKEELINRIGEISKGNDKSFSVGVPPVLGLDEHFTIYNYLKSYFDIFELVLPPPSVPGYRLQRALEKEFLKNNGEIIQAEVVSFVNDKTNIKYINAEYYEKVIEVRAKNYILATGKFIGGGINSENPIVEKIFKLPIFIEGRCIKDIPPYKLFKDEVFASHPIFSAGVRINKNLQPLDENMNVVYDNLFSAGGIIGGYNYIVEKSGLGVCLITGFLAGKNS